MITDSVRSLILCSGLYESSDEDIERLIRMVVRECIVVVEDSDGYSQHFPHVVDNIKAHFGG